MKFKTVLKYPCGYEYIVELQGWFFNAEQLDETFIKPCPIHGKDCRAGGKK